MNFAVIWAPAAEAELADVVLDDPDPVAVTEAALLIEAALAENPSEVGDDLFDTVRVVAYGPLAVEFEVIESDSEVVVLSAWPTALGPPAARGN